MPFTHRKTGRSSFAVYGTTFPVRLRRSWMRDCPLCWPPASMKARRLGNGGRIIVAGRPSMRRTAAALIFAATLLFAQSSYRITHTYQLGGDGSWDYVVPDPPNHRVFIARQNRVMVVDEDSGKLLGEVTGIQGAHGTAIAASTGHGFATSGNDESVVMFDLKTFQSLGRVHAAEDADAILYDAPSNRVFTLNGDAHSSTVIDPKSGSVITNIQLGGKP